MYMNMISARDASSSQASRRNYTAPTQGHVTHLRDLLGSVKRGLPSGGRQFDIFKQTATAPQGEDPTLYYAGDLGLLLHPCVSIVGSREATSAGCARAARLSRELTERGVVIVSGLARGIDTAAHQSTLQSGGRTVAVIGTPLSKTSPVENGPLQEIIWQKHLLMSPFAEGAPVLRSNFPQRNKIMAAVSDATVIVEANDNSGTLHQAVACQKLGRWLFILRSVVDSREWPKRFLTAKNTVILEETGQVFDALGLR